MLPTRGYVGLGANLDDPARQVLQALAALVAIPATRFVAASPLYRSAPLGPPGQPDYVNAVAAVDTGLSSEEMLAALQLIEDCQGRIRGGERWGPRRIDLDLLLFGETECATPRLTLPHPGLHRRAFVLYPLADIAPGLVIPGHGPLADLLAAVPPDGLSRL